VPAFAEVCPDVGATSTILASYLLAAGIEPDPPLATALYYGIKTDTLGLMRQAGPEDMAVYHHLQELVDLEALAEIESAQVPRDYFKRLDAALHAARLYDGVLLSYVGAMQRPDMVAELADLLLRLQGTRWAVCMGKFRDELIVSVRTRNPDGGAGWLVRSIVGQEGTAGGHGTMAAGHLPLGDRNPADLARQLGQQVLLTLGVAAETPGRPLLDGPE
jgi:nanoRNase/pAp phosphatase (c-di-AMP/oligoRNAs hydrolase)